MSYYIQTFILVFIEASCCRIFFMTFLEERWNKKKWVNRGLFFILCIGFLGVASFDVEQYFLKAIFTIAIISILTSIKYKGKITQICFFAIIYYGILIAVDRMVLALAQNVIVVKNPDFYNDPIKTTVLALLCKIILFVCVLFLNKYFKKDGGLNGIANEEWLKFLIFPLISIICLSVFAMENDVAGYGVLITSFGFTLSNFLIFYILQDVVWKEKSIQEIRLSQERVKNQMDMYRYMETIYDEQRKKVHEYKNQIGCIQGLVESGNYQETLSYLKHINNNWIEELDYINTNNVIVNSVLNQKYKLARHKGIAMVLSVNDLGKLAMEEEDIVTVLANLLDNAIEASEKVKDKAKMIKVQFIDVDGVISISVRNPIAESVILDGNIIATTKKNSREHGIGLLNIDNVVQKYNGDNICSCHDGYFTHSITIRYEYNEK